TARTRTAARRIARSRIARCWIARCWIARCWVSGSAPAAQAGLVYELPGAVAVLVGEALVDLREVLAFDRCELRGAVDSLDAPLGRRHELPLGAVGHGIDVQAPQVVHRNGRAVIDEQILEGVRVSVAVRVVGRDGEANGIPREQQLLLPLALLGERPDARRHREQQAHEHDRREESEVREARLARALRAHDAHQVAKGVPFTATSAAPLCTSLMPGWSGSSDCTSVHVSATLVKGSTGIDCT